MHLSGFNFYTLFLHPWITHKVQKGVRSDFRVKRRFWSSSATSSEFRPTSSERELDCLSAGHGVVVSGQREQAVKKETWFWAKGRVKPTFQIGGKFVPRGEFSDHGVGFEHTWDSGHREAKNWSRKKFETGRRTGHIAKPTMSCVFIWLQVYGSGVGLG